MQCYCSSANTGKCVPVPKVQHTLAHVLLQLVDAPVLPQELALTPELHCGDDLNTEDIQHRTSVRVISL
jgi:hypothetical protein